MEPTLIGPFREVVGLGSQNMSTSNGQDPNEAIDIGKWSVCGGGWLESREVLLYIYIYIDYTRAIDYISKNYPAQNKYANEISTPLYKYNYMI